MEEVKEEVIERDIPKDPETNERASPARAEPAIIWKPLIAFNVEKLHLALETIGVGVAIAVLVLILIAWVYKR